jgi:hypothetical protein
MLLPDLSASPRGVDVVTTPDHDGRVVTERPGAPGIGRRPALLGDGPAQRTLQRRGRLLLRSLNCFLLDRTLIWNQRHLLHALREFEQFYNFHRPHQGIANARPTACVAFTDPRVGRGQRPPHTPTGPTSAASSMSTTRCLTWSDGVFGKDRLLTCADAVVLVWCRRVGVVPRPDRTAVDRGCPLLRARIAHGPWLEPLVGTVMPVETCTGCRLGDAYTGDVACAILAQLPSGVRLSPGANSSGERAVQRSMVTTDLSGVLPGVQPREICPRYRACPADVLPGRLLSTPVAVRYSCW